MDDKTRIYLHLLKTRIDCLEAHIEVIIKNLYEYETTTNPWVTSEELNKLIDNLHEKCKEDWDKLDIDQKFT